MANSESRWQRIGYWDFICWFYYLALFASFSTMFDWPIDFRESFGTDTAARKFLALSAFWGCSVLFAQTAMGWKWIPKVFWHMVKYPFSSIKIIIGFVNDSRKKLQSYAQRLPLIPLYFLTLILTLVAGATEKNAYFLAVIKRMAWMELIVVVALCFWWTLNPIPLLDKIKRFSSHALRSKVIQKLATIEVTNAEDAQTEFLKRLDFFKFLARVVPKLLAWISGPKVLFATFALIFSFGVGTSLLLLATILRIEHFTTSGGVFAGDFFQSSIPDFFYVALNHMIGAEVYGVTVISADVRYTLSLLPICMLAFGLLLVTAYTMVGQKSIEKGMDDIGHGLISIASEAAKQLAESKTVHLIDKRKDAKEEIPLPKLKERQDIVNTLNT